eukprot:COSAG04_NODE_3995_length_2371_cov_19.484615_3_plen_184_part_00
MDGDPAAPAPAAAVAPASAPVSAASARARLEVAGAAVKAVGSSYEARGLLRAQPFGADGTATLKHFRRSQGAVIVVARVALSEEATAEGVKAAAVDAALLEVALLKEALNKSKEEWVEIQTPPSYVYMRSLDDPEGLLPPRMPRTTAGPGRTLHVARRSLGSQWGSAVLEGQRGGSSKNGCGS